MLQPTDRRRAPHHRRFLVVCHSHDGLPKGNIGNTEILGDIMHLPLRGRATAKPAPLAVRQADLYLIQEEVRIPFARWNGMTRHSSMLARSSCIRATRSFGSTGLRT